MPPVYPISWEPLRKTGHYRHMARRDAAVWERWLDRFAADFEAVAYDVSMGGVIPTDPAATDAQRRGFQYSTALKIDAVLLGPDGWTILEVRPEPSVSVLGSTLGYKLVAEREKLTDLPIGMGTVCEGIHPDIVYILDQFGVRVWVV